jgi:hypothetical protein
MQNAHSLHVNWGRKSHLRAVPRFSLYDLLVPSTVDPDDTVFACMQVIIGIPSLLIVILRRAVGRPTFGT